MMADCAPASGLKFIIERLLSGERKKRVDLRLVHRLPHMLLRSAGEVIDVKIGDEITRSWVVFAAELYWISLSPCMGKKSGFFVGSGI